MRDWYYARALVPDVVVLSTLGRIGMIDSRQMYLDLLRRSLTRYGFDELAPVQPGANRIARRIARRAVITALARRNYILARVRRFDERQSEKREFGLDWPADAVTMIGMRRLSHLQRCVETVLAEDVPGDLVECGVWRGGASILMRGVLAVHGDVKRRVWLADSFVGLPAPDAVRYPADKGLRFHLAPILAVSEAEVRRNFWRYGLLDDRVRFLPGWFKDTLPGSPIDSIAVLRLDGDLYESTIQALEALYPRLSAGGFCIIDDYHAVDACKKAVADYRDRYEVREEIFEIDGSGCYWRKC